MMKGSILIVRIIIVITVLISQVSADTWHVDDNGADCPGADFTSVQEAIDSTNPGDTFIVYSGTYYENVNVAKRLTLKGIGMPVIDAKGVGDVLTISPDVCTIEGFELRGGGRGIYMCNSSENNILRNDIKSNCVGILMAGGASRNNILWNDVKLNEWGVEIDDLDSRENNVSWNNITNNDWGISIWGSENLIQKNNITFNKEGGITISKVCKSSGICSAGNRIVENDLRQNDDYAIRSQYWRGNEIAGNRMSVSDHLYVIYCEMDDFLSEIGKKVPWSAPWRPFSRDRQDVPLEIINETVEIEVVDNENI